MTGDEIFLRQHDDRTEEQQKLMNTARQLNSELREMKKDSVKVNLISNTYISESLLDHFPEQMLIYMLDKVKNLLVIHYRRSDNSMAQVPYEQYIKEYRKELYDRIKIFI